MSDIFQDGKIISQEEIVWELASKYLLSKSGHTHYTVFNYMLQVTEAISARFAIVFFSAISVSRVLGSQDQLEILNKKYINKQFVS